MIHIERSRLTNVFRGIGGLAVLLALATPPSIAHTPNTVRPLGDDTSASGGDEGIGSLPVIQALSPSAPYVDLLPDRVLGPRGQVRPFVVLSGRKDVLVDMVSDARGSGVITIHPPDVFDPETGEGDWVVGFHGDVEFDLRTHHLDEVEVELRIGGEFRGGVASSCWNGICTPPVLLDEATMNLDLASFVSSGSLQLDDLEVVAISTKQVTATIQFQLLNADEVRVVQTIR
jgi:hypothetical protein